MARKDIGFPRPEISQSPAPIPTALSAAAEILKNFKHDDLTNSEWEMLKTTVLRMAGQAAEAAGTGHTVDDIKTALIFGKVSIPIKYGTASFFDEHEKNANEEPLIQKLVRGLNIDTAAKTLVLNKALTDVGFIIGASSEEFEKALIRIVTGPSEADIRASIVNEFR